MRLIQFMALSKVLKGTFWTSGVVGSGLEVLPIINTQNVPLGHLSNHILRFTGQNLIKQNLFLPL